MIGRKLLLLASISTLAFANTAYAQNIDGAAQPVSGGLSNSEAASPVNRSGEQEIVVTGSRVVTNGNEMPSPVSVVSRDQLLTTTPTNIPDALKKLPAFARSLGTSQPGGNIDNLNGNYLNLRALGAQRTLLLFDGRRVVPTSYSGAVDANVLPQLLLQRVDVVTGGASAVYGSDAVSGVVNFVLDKKFAGLKLEGQSGISGYGDAASWRVGGAFGASFLDGRGHFEASAEHFKQNGILKDDREAGRRNPELGGNGTSSSPFRLIDDGRANYGAFKPFILSGPFAGMVVNANGQLVPFAHGVSGGGPVEGGGDGFYAKGTSATSNLETSQAFARFDFDVTDSLSIFAQGLWSRSLNAQNIFPFGTFGVVISNTNPFLPAALQGQASPFALGRIFDGVSSFAQGNRNTTQTYAGTIGFSQRFGSMTLEGSYEHGRTSSRNETPNSINNGKFYAALDAVDQGLASGRAANGQIICRVNLTNPGGYPGCIPLNPFADPASQSSAINYVLDQNNSNRPRYTLDNAYASLSGTPIENWAGPVKVALSGEYRRLSLNVGSSVLPVDFADCTGILFNCSATTPRSGLAGIAPINVHQTVKEGAIEVLFPLLKDVPFIHSLSLNGAARYTDYSTSGHVVTWKVGGEWSIDGNLHLRATRSRDIRAPSLFELFQSPTQTQSGFTDQHSGGTGGIIALVSSGNANLTPEIANTLTAGAVWRSAAIPGLSVSVDYYRINMSNAITKVDGRLPNIQNVCENSGGSSNFCSLYVRPLPFSNQTPANFPTIVRSQTLNASEIRTWGIDAEVNYVAPLAGGTMSLRALVGYQPQLKTVVAPGLPGLDEAGSAGGLALGALPKWRLTGFVSYSNDQWAIDILERWRSSLTWSNDASQVFAEPNIPAVAYTDVTLTFKFGEENNQNFYVSVQNAFNKGAPVYVNAVSSSFPGYFYPANPTDDIIGRYFSAGVRLKF